MAIKDLPLDGRGQKSAVLKNPVGAAKGFEDETAQLETLVAARGRSNLPPSRGCVDY